MRQVKEQTFGDTTATGGYHGDEDQGQMGALSVLMAVGLFDVQGLADVNPTLEITSPVFDKIVFHLPIKKHSPFIQLTWMVMTIPTYSQFT